MRGKSKGQGSRSKSRSIVPDDALSLQDLDQVVGGAAAAATTKKDDEVVIIGGIPQSDPTPQPVTGGGVLAPTIVAAQIALPTEPVQQTVTDAAAQLASGKIDAEDAIGNVEAYAKANNTSSIGGLADLLDKSHDMKVAAALTAELESGAAEVNLAKLIASGKMNADDAVDVLKHAAESIEKHSAGKDLPTDGLFEMSIAHLYKAAGAQGNTELQNWINLSHNFDLRSGMVELASEQASNDLAAGRINIDAAIKLTTDEAAKQGLPQDLALTSLLVDTHGNAKVADTLASHINAGALVPSPLTNDLGNALAANKFSNEDAVEVIREAIDALQRYAPNKVEGTPDMNFAESLMQMTLGTAGQDADLQTFLKTNYKFELGLGTTLQQVEWNLAVKGMAEAVRVGEYYCWYNGLPTTVVQMALLADTNGNASVAQTLASQIDTFWGSPGKFGTDLQQLMTPGQGYQDKSTGKWTNMAVDDAIALIHSAADVLAKYAPGKAEGNAHMVFCEIITGLVSANGGNAPWTADVKKQCDYDIKLGMVALAAEYGKVYANTAYASQGYHAEGIFGAEYNAKFWSNNQGVPDIYAYLFVLGDAQNGTQGGAALASQHLVEGLVNGTLEKNIVTLVQQGKITVEQGVQALNEAVDVLTRINKLPPGVSAEALRAFALDELRDQAELLPNKGGAAMVTHLLTNFAYELKVGQDMDAYGAKTLQQYVSSYASDPYYARQASLGAMQRELTSGQSDILDLVAKNGMTAQQAEIALIQMAGTGAVPLQVIGEQLNLLITNKGLNAQQLMTDINSYIGSANGLPVDAAVVLLSELGSRGPAIQQAADAMVDSLIASGKITPAALMDCLHDAVTGHTLSDAQALATLTAVAGSTNAALANLAAREMAFLVQRGHVDAAAVIGAIHDARAANLIPVTTAVPILVTLAASGNAAVQTAAGAELGAIAPGAFAASIHNAVMSNSMTVDAALAVLAGAGSAGGPAQTAANTEIAALVQAGRTTVDNAIIALTNVAVGNTVQAIDDAVGREIAALVGVGGLTAQRCVQVMMGLASGGTDAMQRTIGDQISALVAAGKMNADQAMGAMSAMVPNASPAMLTAIGIEMVQLFAHKNLNMNINQWWGDVWNSPLQPANGTKFWTVFAAMLTEAGPDLLPTLQNHTQNIMRNIYPGCVGTAMAAIDVAVSTKGMSPMQAAEALSCMTGAFRNAYDYWGQHAMNAISAECATLVAQGHLSSVQVMHEMTRVVCAGTPALDVLMRVAGSNNMLRAGVGEEIGVYAIDKKLTQNQVADLISKANVTDPAARLCLWAGINAAAPQGEIRDLADRNLTAMVIPERVNNSWGGYQGSAALSAQDAIRILAGLGTGNDANLRDVALSEIADLVQSPTGLNRGSLDIYSALNVLEQMAARGDAKTQGFIGAELAALAAKGVPLQTIMDQLTQAVNGGQLRSDVALTMLAAAGENGTGSLRVAAANAIQTMVDYGRISNAQLSTFMANHLYDGMTEAILLDRVMDGRMQASQLIPTLNGLVDTYIKTHPDILKSHATAVMLAHLEIAVNAGLRANPPVSQQDNWWGGGYSDNGANQRLQSIQDIMHKSVGTMGQVLSGLGMLQMRQESNEGIADVMVNTRISLGAYVVADTGRDPNKTYSLTEAATYEKAAQVSADKAIALLESARDGLAPLVGPLDTARQAVIGFSETQDAHSKVGLLGKALDNPRSYEAWAALYGNIAGGQVASQFLGTSLALTTGCSYAGLILTAVSLSSKGLDVMFKQEAVVNALGPTAAGALGTNFALISSCCDFATTLAGGVMEVTMVSMADTAVNMGQFINAWATGNDADTMRYGVAMMSSAGTALSGITAQSQQDTYDHGKGAWDDIMALRDPRDNLNALKQDIDDMFGSKNAYIQGANNAYSTATNGVVKAAYAVGNAFANIGNTTAYNVASGGVMTGYNAVTNWGGGAVSTVSSGASSAISAVSNFFSSW